MEPKRPKCKSCGSFTRKLTPPGPRCVTCHREERNRRKTASHERYVQVRYGLPPGGYAALYEAQGGHCALCGATGRAKRLAVDHDHACCSGPESCGKCVRGLLCGPCNDVLAVARDNPAYFTAALNYLMSPPAKGINAHLSNLRQDAEGHQ